MRHVYIDLGCFDGDTCKEFRNWKSLAYSPDIEWEMYGFDPQDFSREWVKHPWVKFDRKAAWIEDGEIDFSVNGIGSTVMEEKDTWDAGEKVRVPCFDFSQWLKQFNGDHVIIKMDIEGAEGPVLTKMIEDGTDSIPELMLIEWHDVKMVDKGYVSNRDWIWDNLKCEWRYFR